MQIYVDKSCLYKKALGILLLNALLWVIIPWVFNQSFPLDVAEQIAWGGEWAWGYYKHPFLPAWLAQLFYEGLGTVGPYLLSQLAILATLYFVYRLGERIIGKDRAVLGTLSTLGVFYFIWPTPEWNNNVAQLPFWSAAIYFFYRATRDSGYVWWIYSGIALGLGMLSKYSTVILAGVFILYLVADKNQRRNFIEPKLWLGVLALIVVFLPNLLWMAWHDFLPIHYALNRATGADQPGWMNAWVALRFVIVQLLDALPVVLILAASGLLLPRYVMKSNGLSPDAVYLWAMAAGPVVLTAVLAAGLGLGLRDMWGAPMLNLIGILLASFFLPLELAQWKKLLRVVLGFVLIVALGGVIVQTMVPKWGSSPGRNQWPEAAIQQVFDGVWRNRVPDEPLKIIAGDHWLGDLMAIRPGDRPKILIDGNVQISTGLNQHAVHSSGALLLWRGEPAQIPPALAALGARAYSGTETFAWPINPTAPPLRISWAIILPNASPP